MYDFAVVGVGPAGARVARRAAEAGYDVIAFEQGSIGVPLACSGHVSRDIWEYAPAGAREELLQNEVYGADFHVGGPGSRAYPFYKDGPVSNVIHREELDRILADAARDAGATVKEGHTVTGVDEGLDSVELTVSPDDDDPFSIEAKMVAGCDGPVSRVRRAVDLPEPEEKLHGVLGFDPEPDHGDFVDVHLTAPSFFAWRIPRGEAGVEYGLAVRPDADEDARSRFDRLVDAYGAEIDRFCSGAIPIGPSDSVTAHRVFLVGDAAAQTKPFTGGGILYGMRSADNAVRTIDPDDPATLSAYEAAWRDELETEIRLGHWLRRAYSLPEPVQRLGLRLTAGEIGVHMDQPTTLFSREHLRSYLP